MATPNAKLAGRPDRHARDRAIMVARHLAARGADRARALWLPRAVALRPVRYGRMALSRGYAVCEKPVADALLDLLKKRLDYLIKDGEAFFSAEQNSRIVTAAEQYYRVMYYGDAVSWNLARPAYVRHAGAAASASRARLEGRGLGA